MPKINTSSGVIKYKTTPLYPGVKRINKTLAFENLQIVHRILIKNQISCLLIAGTLLGVIRGNDFIDHDEDIDLALIEEDKQRFFDVLPQLIDLDFQIARYDRRGLLSIMRKGEYIDFYFFSQYTSKIRSCGGWLVLDEFLTRTTEIDFKGESFKIPENYEGFLCCEYGENWRTPIQWFDYNMPKWKNRLLELKEHIKDILPNWLYFALAKRAEKKMQQKYLAKIEIYSKQIKQ